MKKESDIFALPGDSSKRRKGRKKKIYRTLNERTALSRVD